MDTSLVIVQPYERKSVIETASRYKRFGHCLPYGKKIEVNKKLCDFCPLVAHCGMSVPYSEFASNYVIPESESIGNGIIRLIKEAGEYSTDGRFTIESLKNANKANLKNIPLFPDNARSVASRMNCVNKLEPRGLNRIVSPSKNLCLGDGQIKKCAYKKNCPISPYSNINKSKSE